MPFGFSYDRRASRLIESVEIIRLLWATTEPVDFDGDFFKLDQAILGAEPFGDAPPPLWMAAHRPRVLRAAGRLADGWLPIFLDAGDYGRPAGRPARRERRGRAPRGRGHGRASYAWLVVDEDPRGRRAPSRLRCSCAWSPSPRRPRSTAGRG